MNKIKESFKKIGSFLLTLIILAVIAFIIFNIYKSVMQNYKINEQIVTLELEIEEIKQHNKYLENLIIYYNTNTFKELELRRKLGMRKSDEKMLIISENRSSEEKKEPGTPSYKPTEETKNQNPNYKKWWDFIRGKST